MRRRDNKQKNVAIFDFDGTLADVVVIFREVYGQIAQKYDYPELTEEAFQKLRRGTLREVMKWVGVRPWQITGLLREGRTLFYERRKDIKLFPGVLELIQQLDKREWDLYILSSNSTITIREILAKNGVGHEVMVLKRPPLFGKAGSIKGLVRRKKYDKNRVWMVGDEVRDIEAATKAGVQSIGVAWGLQHESALAKANPTFVALKVSELKNYLLKGE